MGKTSKLVDFFKKNKAAIIKKNGDNVQYFCKKELEKTANTKGNKTPKRKYKKVANSIYLNNNKNNYQKFKILDNIPIKDSSQGFKNKVNIDNKIEYTNFQIPKANNVENTLIYAIKVSRNKFLKDKTAKVSSEQLKTHINDEVLNKKFEDVTYPQTFASYYNELPLNRKANEHSNSQDIFEDLLNSSISSSVSNPRGTSPFKYNLNSFGCHSSILDNGNSSNLPYSFHPYPYQNIPLDLSTTHTNSFASVRTVSFVSRCTQTDFSNFETIPVETQFSRVETEVRQLTKPYEYNEKSLNLKNAFSDVCKLIIDFDNLDVEEYLRSSQPSDNLDEPKIRSKQFTLTNQSISLTYELKMWSALQDSTLLSKDKIKLPKSSTAIKDKVLTSIRNIFQELRESLEKNEKLVLKYRKMKDWRNTVFIEDRLQLKPKEAGSFSSIVKNRKMSEHKFGLMIYLLIKIYNLVSSESMCTKREIYYEIVNFVKRQLEINIAIDTIACLLEVPQWDLGIMSDSKGLVYGDLKIQLKLNETINFGTKGTLIPNDLRDIKEIVSDASFILVVEKEAVFQKLIDEKIYNQFCYKFILVTGKGYPDISTRLLTRILTDVLKIPVFIFVDADPLGIDIMLTYKYGSLSTCFMSKELAIPNIRWIGVHPSEMKLLNVEEQALNVTDLKKIKDMLKRPYFEKDSKIKQEILVLLKNKHKAEIKGLINSRKYLGQFYLPNKMNSANFF